MACQEGAEDHLASSAPADDFEFCILSSGGLAPAGDDAAADMCVADEVFSGGKLLPLRLSSADAASAALLLLRSDSLDGAATSTATSSSGYSSRSVSRSSSSCVSRSTSSNSASSSDNAGPGGSSSSSKQSASSSADAAVPPRRSLSGSVFYAHPSPSPRPPPRGRSRTSAPAAAARRSTGSAPPASWGVIRLGVVGAPEVLYAPRPAEYRKPAAPRSGNRSARFESAPADKKLALGLLGAGLVCSCSPDAVAPVGSAEVAAAEARRRRKKAEEKKRAASATATQSGKGTARSSRILEWLEDLSISKEKSAAPRRRVDRQRSSSS
ncbi:unnamed protein product [Miscanthus lutarioriparius]|uniref:Uncharacterized protein n=1 Tax=Miscanthus lutarioriparius TaxID=422564 RepID=A0A811MBL4_9POAL|nr:unnamed protein product [Miscanthus lutarioriparius]